MKTFFGYCGSILVVGLLASPLFAATRLLLRVPGEMIEGTCHLKNHKGAVVVQQIHMTSPDSLDPESQDADWAPNGKPVSLVIKAPEARFLSFCHLKMVKHKHIPELIVVTYHDDGDGHQKKFITFAFKNASVLSIRQSGRSADGTVDTYQVVLAPEKIQMVRSPDRTTSD